MTILSGFGCALSILGFWVLPIVLGIKAARRNNRSPHWMWFGVHPLGAWIAFLVLQFSAPLKRCSNCGETVKVFAKICPYCTTPFGEPPAALPEPVASRKQWIWIGGLVAAGILGFVGFFFFVSGMVDSSIKDTGAYRAVMQQVESDPRATELLGTPIGGMKVSSASISTSNDTEGDVDLSASISGPKGSAGLHAVGKMHRGAWTFSVLKIEPNNGGVPFDIAPKP